MLLPRIIVTDHEGVFDGLIERLAHERRVDGNEMLGSVSPLQLFHLPDDGTCRSYELKYGNATVVQLERRYTQERLEIQVARLMALAPGIEPFVISSSRDVRLIAADKGFCAELYQKINTFYTPEWFDLPWEPRHFQGKLDGAQMEKLIKHCQFLDLIDLERRCYGNTENRVLWSSMRNVVWGGNAELETLAQRKVFLSNLLQEEDLDSATLAVQITEILDTLCADCLPPFPRVKSITEEKRRQLLQRLAIHNRIRDVIVLNTSFDLLATWLERYISLADLESFPIQKGKIVLQPHIRRIIRNGSMFIEIIGNYTKFDEVGDDIVVGQMAMIRFEIFSLSSKSIEVRAECYQKVVEPYFRKLLTDIAMRWQEADSAGSTRATKAPRLNYKRKRPAKNQKILDRDTTILGICEQHPEWHLEQIAEEARRKLSDDTINEYTVGNTLRNYELTKKRADRAY